MTSAKLVIHKNPLAKGTGLGMDVGAAYSIHTLGVRHSLRSPLRDSLRSPVSACSQNRPCYRYLDRGRQNSIVLVPGWACDYRIFETLDLRFNYLIPPEFSPVTFEEDLLSALRENDMAKVSLFGHSLGGFAAAEFASKYPDLVDELILVSIRKRYKAENLEEIRRHLKKSKRGYLYKFYTHCFSKKEDMSWFRENLLKIYCKELDLDYLLRTLDYLRNAEIRPELLTEIKKITIIHGECDRIAPIREAIDIKERLPQARFVCIKNAGHIPWGFFHRGHFTSLGDTSHHRKVSLR